MSHVAQVDLVVKDLGALKEACKRLGLEFVEGQQTYKWYGKHVGDYSLPTGYSAQDLGKCEHAIRIPKGHPAWNENNYELGVARRRDGKPGMEILWDFFAGGYGLQAIVGQGCQALKQSYATVVATRQAQRAGMRVQEFKLPNGAVQLRCTK